MGSHGPAYFKRYPPGAEHFRPNCNREDINHCTQQQIINSYDNSLRYTDTVLNQLITLLQRQQGYQSALMFVSDHGESLGEMGVYLHGLPYLIAPEEQTQVPMVWWLSTDFQRTARIATRCLQTKAGNPASHDNIFHSILGMMDVVTTQYQARLDLGSACHAQATTVTGQG
jgi:lipid A ethanolaminephosphotransferase